MGYFLTLRLRLRHCALDAAFHPFNEVLREVLEMLNASDVLAILRIILKTVLEPVQGSDPEVVHVAVSRLTNCIQNKSGGGDKSGR